MGEPDFFVSYTSADMASATWIVTELENAGYTTVSQARDFRAGHDFVHEMHRAVASAKRTIAVLSPAYLASEFGEAEWRVAFADDPSGERGKLVPVKVRACEAPGLLRGRVHIDLVDVDTDIARQRLLDGVSSARRSSGGMPFPGTTARRRRQRLFAGLVAVTALLGALATSTAWALSSAAPLSGGPSAAGDPAPVTTPTDVVTVATEPAPPADSSDSVSGGPPADAPRVGTLPGEPPIKVAPPTIPPLKITTGSLPKIALGKKWTAKFEVSGGVGPYTWSFSGTLPAGLGLVEKDGRIEGTTTVSGPAAFTITVEDSRQATASRDYELLVPPPDLGDLEPDGDVDCDDLKTLESQWNKTGPDLSGDLNEDRIVNLTDMSTLLSNWTGGDSSNC